MSTETIRFMFSEHGSYFHGCSLNISLMVSVDVKHHDYLLTYFAELLWFVLFLSALYYYY